MQAESIKIAKITIGDGRRAVDQDAVSRLAQSIKSIGLMTPITVRCSGDGYRLVAGRHRVEAYRHLGLAEIPADILGEDDEQPERAAREDRMLEISENLHRSELTVVQRSEYLTEWLWLAGFTPPPKSKVGEAWSVDSPTATVQDGSQPSIVQTGQVAQKLDGHSGNGLSAQLAQKLGRPEGGNSAAARALGIKRDEVARARKIGGMSEEVLREAERLGLADNQAKLLVAASEPIDKQMEKLRELAQPSSASPRDRLVAIREKVTAAMKLADEAGFDDILDLLAEARNAVDWRGRSLSAPAADDHESNWIGAAR